MTAIALFISCLANAAGAGESWRTLDHHADKGPGVSKASWVVEIHVTFPSKPSAEEAVAVVEGTLLRPFQRYPDQFYYLNRGVYWSKLGKLDYYLDVEPYFEKDLALFQQVAAELSTRTIQGQPVVFDRVERVTDQVTVEVRNFWGGQVLFAHAGKPWETDHLLPVALQLQKNSIDADTLSDPAAFLNRMAEILPQDRFEDFKALLKNEVYVLISHESLQERRKPSGELIQEEFARDFRRNCLMPRDCLP